MKPAAGQIICPNCGTVISLTDALTADLRASFQQEYAAKLEEDRKVIERELKAELTKQNSTKLEDLENALAQKDAALLEAQKNEVGLRKKTRELEEREKTVELEVQRKLDQEKAVLEEKVTERILGENRLKLSEKDQQLEVMRHQIEELRRKAEQGSQQLQGETLEVELEALLKSRFPEDVIEPVPKGIRGADLLQHVMIRGNRVGTIIWEAKRTKGWQDGWLAKLREDQRAVTAECSILVTEILPKDLKEFAYIEGVWVTKPATALGLGAALRIQLEKVAELRRAEIGRTEKKEMLYEYLTGTQFRHHVEALVEAFVTLQDELQKEKRAVQKLWASRDKQHEKVLRHIAGMYGDIHGVVGSSLPEIKGLGFDVTPQLESKGEAVDVLTAEMAALDEPNHESSNNSGSTNSTP